MESIVAEQRIKKALKSKLPPATKHLLKPGDNVRVYREHTKRWDGPFTITKIGNKMVSVTDVKTLRNSILHPSNPSLHQLTTQTYYTT